jgi:hypothetical protein
MKERKKGRKKECKGYAVFSFHIHEFMFWLKNE